MYVYSYALKESDARMRVAIAFETTNYFDTTKEENK